MNSDQHVADQVRTALTGEKFPMVATFGELVGKTLTAITISVGADEAIFFCADGSRYRMYHQQDCCENVYIQDIVGDIADLLGTPLLRAEEAINPSDAPGRQDRLMGFFHLDFLQARHHQGLGRHPLVRRLQRLLQ